MFRTIGALQAANVNVITLAEKHIAPMVLSAVERLMQERLNSQMQEKGLSKHNNSRTKLETLFIVDTFQLKNH